jgi:hypothetical protein
MKYTKRQGEESDLRTIPETEDEGGSVQSENLNHEPSTVTLDNPQNNVKVKFAFFLQHVY